MAHWSLLFLTHAALAGFVVYVYGCSSCMYVCSQEMSPSEADLDLSSFKFSGRILHAVVGCSSFPGQWKLLESFDLFPF